MKTKDLEAMAEIYNSEILEEGWKGNLAGMGAAGLAAASLWPKEKPDTVHNTASQVSMEPKNINELFESGKVMSLIKSYYHQRKGMDVNVIMKNDNLSIGGKIISRAKLEALVNRAMNEGAGDDTLAGYIANHM